jgi:hypothetical protein
VLRCASSPARTRRAYAGDLADDLLNGFIADKVLAAGLMRHAAQGRGKFRNFVLKSLSNFVTTKLRSEYAARALASGFDEGVIPSAAAGVITDRFEREWVQQVVRDALRMMEVECRAKGRSDMWEMFRLRVVDPMLQDVEPVDYEQIVQQLGIATPRQAMNLLANAKRAFLGHVEAAVGKYVSGDEIEAEIADLREIVGR